MGLLGLNKNKST